jgi:hypothetical protein
VVLSPNTFEERHLRHAQKLAAFPSAKKGEGLFSYSRSV